MARNIALVHGCQRQSSPHTLGALGTLRLAGPAQHTVGAVPQTMRCETTQPPSLTCQVLQLSQWFQLILCWPWCRGRLSLCSQRLSEEDVASMPRPLLGSTAQAEGHVGLLFLVTSFRQHRADSPAHATPLEGPSSGSGTLQQRVGSMMPSSASLSTSPGFIFGLGRLRLASEMPSSAAAADHSVVHRGTAARWTATEGRLALGLAFFIAAACTAAATSLAK